MDSGFIVNAVRRKYSGRTIFLPEVTLEDEYYNILARNDLVDRYGLPESDRITAYEHDSEYTFSNGSQYRRIDLLGLDSQHKWTAVEIKVSRADFARETYEKRHPWIKKTHRFVYAVPEGLVTPDEIPNGCGLWTIADNGQVTVAKKARVNRSRQEFPETFLRTLFWRLYLSDNGRSGR